MGRMHQIGICLVAAGVVLATPLQAARRPKPWAALEAKGARIGTITVEIGDVFDLANPKENTKLGRTADKLHATTHEPVIRRVLLFVEGDRVSERRIYETERLLRALPFVKDAHIDPVTNKDGTITARVRVRDAWTTQVNLGAQSVGGQKTMFIGLNELNFMGLGKSVAFDLSKDHERSTWGLAYEDPQFLGTRWTLGTHWQVLSDGLQRTFHVERPFFALDTPWSTGLTMMQHKDGLNVYDRGILVYHAPFLQNGVRLFGAMAMHEAGDRVWRGGVLMVNQDTSYGPVTQLAPPGFTPPPPVTPRRLRGPGLTLSTQKDSFESFVDLQGMDTPEDYNLAWTGSLEMGNYLRSWGSSMAAPFAKLAVAKGWSHASEDLTLLAVTWEARKPATGVEGSLLSLALSQYWKLTDHHILAAAANVDVARRPDPENVYYFGDEQGMRGFPNQMHPGDARWVTSFDYRFLTEQRWWSLVRLGYSVFADVGAVRRLDGQGWYPVCSDVGVGLRLGNLKSTQGRVILLSVAVPLKREPGQNKYQLTVGNTMRF